MLHELLAGSSKKNPSAVAVRYKGEEMTYGDLEVVSNQFASALRGTGVETGDRVGLYSEKSPHAIAAIFGILKCGACYVPLDPTAPPERQALILNDCGIETLVVSENKAGVTAKIAGMCKSLKHVVLGDRSEHVGLVNMPGVKVTAGREVLGMACPSKVARTGGEDLLAYCLYTSGSTGQPKGVMISHSAAMAFVDWAHDVFAICPEDIVSSHAPYHFDLSILDIFASVKAGATICIIPPGVSGFPKSLAELLEKEELTVWYSVPSVLTQMALHGDLQGKNLASLRLVLFAGEVFPTKHLRRLMELVPHAHYYNLFGPTETNVCTYHHVAKRPESDGPIPIGRPCAGQDIYIVDSNGSLAGDGEIGELYVSGPTLMSGYWNDPEKTKSVLFPNSFAGGSGNVYKTGDLVHRHANGLLESHGRKDQMIKSRGYRIELGEIESVVSLHPAVKEAVAVAVQDEDIGKRIVVFVVLHDGSGVASGDILLHCSKKLPPYMMPGAIRMCSSLPQTSTNKVDRRELERNAE